MGRFSSITKIETSGFKTCANKRNTEQPQPTRQNVYNSAVYCRVAPLLLGGCSTAGWATGQGPGVTLLYLRYPRATYHCPYCPSILAQLNEVHIFFPVPDSASALLLCTELVHLHPPSPSLHLPAISAWSSGAIPREYHIRCHNTRQIVQQCGEGHTFNT